MKYRIFLPATVFVLLGITPAQADHDITSNVNFKLMKKARNKAELGRYVLGALYACNHAYVDKSDPGLVRCTNKVISALFSLRKSSTPSPTPNYSALARRWRKATYAVHYFRLAARCPKGKCPNPEMTKRFRHIRKNAYHHCYTAYAVIDRNKAEACRKAVLSVVHAMK